MSTKIKIRRDLKQNWESYNPVLDDGELALVKDTGEIKIGNGTNRVMEIPSINNSFNGYAWELIKELGDGNGDFEFNVTPEDDIRIEVEQYGVDNGVGVAVKINDITENKIYNSRFYGQDNDSTRYDHYSFDSIHLTANSYSMGILDFKCKFGFGFLHKYVYNSSNGYEYNMFSHIWVSGNELPITKLTVKRINNFKGRVKIFKRVQIVSQAPYKKLIASASNVKDINGIVVNIDQNKKYEIELEQPQEVSYNDIKFFINNDNNTVYKHVGLYNYGNTASVNNVEKDSFILPICLSSKGVFSPFTKIFTYKNTYLSSDNTERILTGISRYKGSETIINTLNFIAPNDDITCRFKVWEITY